MKTLYPRIPVQLNQADLKNAISTGLHYLAIGKNPQKAHFNGSERVKVKIVLNDYAEGCLTQLTRDPSFKSQNEIIVFCLQFLQEARETRPQMLTTRLM